jgi:hypothetical protein
VSTFLSRWLRRLQQGPQPQPDQPREAGPAPDASGDRPPAAPDEPPAATRLRELIDQLVTDPGTRERLDPANALESVEALVDLRRDRLAADLLLPLTTLWPGHGRLRLRLAELLLGLGDRRRAVELLEALTRDLECRVQAHFLLGDQLGREADVEAALRHYEAVLALDFLHPRARARADDLRRRLDRPGASSAPTVLGAPDLGQGDRFVLQRELGRGGGGTVYLAFDRSLGHPVALKVLHPHVARQAGAREHLFCEARIATSLRHPLVVTIYDLDESLNMVVMEYCAAGTLAGAGLPLAPGAALARLAQVASVLDWVHRHGVVHRDLKPSNLLLRRAGGWLVLTDFGIAHAGPDDPSGAAAGSLVYMAPEQRQGETGDPRVDLYACGVLLLEMLLGRPPLDPTQALQGQPILGLDELWREVRAGVPLAVAESLMELARELLQPAAARRPTSASELSRRAASLARTAWQAGSDPAPDRR